MTFGEPSWLGPVLAEDFALFQVLMVTNSYFCHTDFAPLSHSTAGHMLEVFIIGKDTTFLIGESIVF